MSLESEAMKQGGVPEGYTEVDVEFFSFKVPGDKITGTLLEKRETTVGQRNNKIGKYIIRTMTGKKFAFLGSVQLDEKMKTIPLGSECWIEYIGEQETDQNFKMKTFKVFVKSIR